MRACRSLCKLALAISAVACHEAIAFGDLLLIEAPPTTATLAIGPSLWSLPRFPGARNNQTTAIVGIDYVHPSGLFLSTDTGAGWNFSSSKDLQAGLRLWPQLARRQADVPRGIGAIGARLQAEAFLNYAPLPVLLLQSGLLRGSGHHHDGVKAEFGVTSGLPIGADLLGIGLAASYANQAYRQDYFGVSAAESQASGLAVQRMSAGWQDISLTFSGEHRFSDRWHAQAQLILARLARPAFDSPLATSRRQVAGTMTLWRDF